MREMILALCVSKKYQKREIAELYLRVAYFGWKMNGVEQACQRLDMALGNMSIDDAAYVIATLKYPLPRLAHKKRLALISRRQAHIVSKLRGANGRDKAN